MEVPPFTVAGAAEQLVRTEELLRAVGAGEAPATLRWYSYGARAVILGVGQPFAIVDEAACRAAGVAVVKRRSGGTVVFATPAFLALDVALPATHPLALHDVIEAYRWVGETFQEALASLAPAVADRIVLVDVSTARADQQAQKDAAPDTAQSLRSLACFGVLSPYEVGLVRAGHAAPAKLVGLSQIRRRGVVLFQAGVYTGSPEGRPPLTDLPKLLALPPPFRQPLAQEIVDATADLRDLGLDASAGARLMKQVTARAAARFRAADRAASAQR